MQRFLSFVLIAFVIFASAMTADAFYGDVDKGNKNFTLGVAGQGDDLNASATGIFPIEMINGWLGVYGSHQEAGDVVSARVANGHLQGAIPIGRYSLEGFIDATHNKGRAIDLSLLGGYFFRLGRYDVGKIVLSGGAGNYTENRDLDDDIGRAADDKATTFGWLVFVSGKLAGTKAGDISGTVRYKPEIQFDHYALETSISFNKKISNSMAVGATFFGLLDTNTHASIESDWHSSYLLTVTYTPEN